MIYIGLIIIFYSIFLFVLSSLIIVINKNVPKKSKENKKYCILIPARNESRVIEDLLISIENQTEKIDSKDVYIIVESKDDPTVEITKKHNMNIVFRKDLTKKRKGYALDDAVKEILKDNKKYTAYFILDADNVLDKNFIKEMSSDIDKGYDISIGYRNTKNGNNLVSCASALSFYLLNTLDNERKCKYNNTLSISGTGFYIKGNIIESLGGFPFNSLTEDYELTLYCTLNNLTTNYNSNAIFYDEQPEKFNMTITQRTRWVKGYFEARKKYLKEIKKNTKIKDINFSSKLISIIGINPIIYLVIGLVMLLIGIAIKYSFINFVYSLLITVLSLYLIFVLITFVLLKKENDKLNINVSKFKLILYNPIFLFSYTICFFKAILTKNVEWKAIPHTKELKLEK